MKLQKFINKNNIKVSDKTLKLCKEGLKIMGESIDPIHDRKHIEDIFNYLDYLIEKVPDIKNIVIFDVLLLGICWHDTWKAFHNTNNAFVFVYHQFLEGMGSARIFRKRAYVEDLSRDIIREVSYIIRKHSVFNIIRSENIELKILLDLDSLEMWNVTRIRKTQDMFFNNKYFYKRTTKLFYKYLAKKKMRFNILEELITEKKESIINYF